MQNLIKQSRVRFSAKREESSSFKGQQIPLQKTQSFKGEKKRGQNWFQRQFSDQMSQSYDFNNGIEKIVAVAAAAYVIDSIEESSVRDQKRIDEGPQPSFTKPKSRKADSEVPITTATEEKGPAMAAGSAPIKKTITFSDRPSERTNTFPSRTPSKPDLPPIKPITSIKPESGATNADISTIKNGSAATRADIPTAKPRHAVPKTEIPTTYPGRAAQKTDIHATKPQQPQAIEHGTQRPATGETEASTWERAKMAKIKERYEKLNSTIVEWENKKKTRAKNKLHKTEGELELRRAKALRKFQNEMKYIKQVVEGARAQAEERRKNEELKVRQKANIIETTGRVPRTCFCL